VIAARGEGRLESVTLARLDQAWRPVPGTERTLDADVLAAGYGFVPQVELLGEAGAQLAPGAPAVVAVAGPDQQTTVPGLFAAGETTGVGGSDLARIEGEIAGRAAARFVGRSPDRFAGRGVARAVTRPPRAVVRDRDRLRRFAAVMQAVHAVQPGWADWPGDDTVVCRCEEVTLGRMRAAAGLGADDARSIKLLARPGMGWCQGRICGPTVDALLAAGLGPAAAEDARPADVSAPSQSPAAEPGPTGQAGGPLLSRPLAQPVPLGVLARLAGLDEPSGAEAARPDATGTAEPGTAGAGTAGAGTAGAGTAGAGTAGAGRAGAGTAEAGARETGAAPDDEGKM
jgi:hypothetical protein